VNGDRPAGKRNRSLLLRSLIFAAAIVVGVPLLGRGCGSCMGYQDLVMERVNACPAVVAELGSPIKESLIGLSCGSAKTSGSYGRASWTSSVSGPKGRGRYSYTVRREGGPWRLISGTLKANGKTIDVGMCAVVGGGDAIAGPQRFTGEVTSTVGTTAPVAKGAACTVTVTPGGDDKPCRTEVRCGGAAIYGATSNVGYASCSSEQGPDGKPALVVQDRDFTPQGGDPALDLRAAKGELVVSDQLPTGMWVVNIKLAGGPSAPASAPAPAAAPTPAPAPGPGATPI
jgi:hypothetical protein